MVSRTAVLEPGPALAVLIFLLLLVVVGFG
jgi:hypothetical protein